jgi:Flp pilus assembly protein TadG
MTFPARGFLTQRLKRRMDRLSKDQKGAAAVEFAMIAAPFFFLIFGLLEVCMLFIMSTVMEHAVSESSRVIRTGQAQQDGFDETEFRDLICTKVFDLLECDEQLHIDVEKLDSFSGGSTAVPIDAGGNVDTSEFGFDPGGPNEVVAVRAYYEWSLITPVLSAPLSNMNGGKHLIQANAVFRNEPYGE